MIRKAEQTDLSRIAEILVFGKRTAYRSIFKDDLFSFNELQVLNVIQEYMQNPEVLDNVLVYDDGIVKGMLNRKQPESADEVELCELYVEPFFKGTGVGCRLMEYLIEEAKVNQKKSIYLWVLKDNLSARRFYEKNGFAPTSEEKLNEGTDIWDVKYVKIL